MKKFWPFLFFLVPIGGLICFAIAPGMNWWLPEDVSTHGYEIDHLFFVILWITGVAFVLVNAALVLFMWKYPYKEGHKGTYIHTHHTAEVVWTVIPGLILVFIAFYQFGAWKKAKFVEYKPENGYPIHVMAGQFEWRITYAGEDGKFKTRDDLISVNQMHVPVNTPILVTLESRDVLHSFYLPNLRVKQDAVPGMKIPVWFEATKAGQYDLACAELCGWGHYKMKGRLFVDTKDDFEAWLKKAKEDQEASE